MAIHNTISILSILLLTSSLSVATARKAPDSVSFIRTSCTKATYPRLCFASVSSFASSIQNSPTKLADTALSVSLVGARNTSTALSALCHKTKMKPRVVEAMMDCIENMGFSINELRRSMRQMGYLGGKDTKLKIDNIKTWVSAALTDEETCMDGFDEKATGGEVKKEVRVCIEKVAQLTSNALALVNGLWEP